MKLTAKTIKPLKPRNPFVAAALRRPAGSHRQGMATARQTGRRELRAELKQLHPSP
jgi:hypothetical protein